MKITNLLAVFPGEQGVNVVSDEAMDLHVDDHFSGNVQLVGDAARRARSFGSLAIIFRSEIFWHVLTVYTGQVGQSIWDISLQHQPLHFNNKELALAAAGYESLLMPRSSPLWPARHEYWEVRNAYSLFLAKHGFKGFAVSTISPITELEVWAAANMPAGLDDQSENEQE